MREECPNCGQFLQQEEREILSGENEDISLLEITVTCLSCAYMEIYYED